jgi:ParB-like nuclease domain
VIEAALRTIDPTGYAKINIPVNFGKKPKLEWLSISTLVVDPQYQREITLVGRKNVRHIAENFNWSMFAPVIVAGIGGGRYAIVDGQHRTTAAALCGIDRVPCDVIEALRGDQARSFRAINANTTRPHTVQLFHAAVAAGETSALQIIDVCKKAGIRIPRSLAPCKNYETYCVGAIGKAIERHGEDATALSLRLIVHSGDGMAAELNRTIIVAVTEVIGRNPDWHDREAALKEVFEDFTLEDMWRDATATAARTKGSSSTDVLIGVLSKRLITKLGGKAAA